jgi:outer membrane lipoprotein-sorting protein
MKQVAVLLVIFAACSQAHAQSSQEVVEVMAMREASLKSIDIRWSGTSFASGERLARRSRSSTNLEDMTFPVRGVLLFERPMRMRLEYSTSEWSRESDGLMEGTQVMVIADGTQRMLLTGGLSQQNDMMLIRDAPSNPTNTMALLPINLAFWPLDPNLGLVALDKLEPSPRHSFIDNRSHLILVADDVEVWVDPSRQYLPVRYRGFVEGALGFTVDIVYVESDSWWLPHSWKLNYFDQKGTIENSEVCTVESVVVNPSFDAATFSLAPGRGVYVSDMQLGKDYMALGGDRKRIIRPGEFTGDNFEELMHDRYATMRFWGAMVAVALVAVIALAFVYKKRLAR